MKIAFIFLKQQLILKHSMKKTAKKKLKIEDLKLESFVIDSTEKIIGGYDTFQASCPTLCGTSCVTYCPPNDRT